jgi:hypothetical protein
LTDIAWSTSEEDGDWSSSTLTSSIINLAGLYSITAGYARSASSGSSTVVVQVHINSVLRRSGRAPNVNAIAADASCAMVEMLEVGDAIKVKAQTGGGATTTISGCGLEIVRIGPVRWT